MLNNPAGFIWPNECEVTWIAALIKLLLQINKRANKKAPWHQDETTLFFRVLHILSIRITIEKWHEYCDEMPSSLALKLIAICKNIKEWLNDSQSQNSDAANRLDNNTRGLSTVIFSNNLDRLVSYIQSIYLAEGTNIPDVSGKFDIPEYIRNSDSDPSGKSSLTKAASHNSGASDGVWYT